MKTWPSEARKGRWVHWDRNVCIDQMSGAIAGPLYPFFNFSEPPLWDPNFSLRARPRMRAGAPGSGMDGTHLVSGGAPPFRPRAACKDSKVQEPRGCGKILHPSSRSFRSFLISSPSAQLTGHKATDQKSACPHSQQEFDFSSTASAVLPQRISEAKKYANPLKKWRAREDSNSRPPDS